MRTFPSPGRSLQPFCRFIVSVTGLFCAFAPIARAACLDYRNEGIRLVEEEILSESVARAVDGRYLYATRYATDEGQIQVFDLEAHELLGSINLGPIYFGGIVCDGSLLYVTTYRSMAGNPVFDVKLHIISVADPTAPVLFSSITLFSEGSRLTGGLAIAQGHLYVSASREYDGEIVIVDATDPLAPEIVGSLDSPARRIRAVDGLLYVGTARSAGGVENALRIYDLVEAAAPLLRASLHLADDPVSLAVGDGYAYVGLDGFVDDRVEIIEVSGLSGQDVPRIVASIPHYALDLQISGPSLFGAAPDQYGLPYFWAADISNPLAPSVQGAFPFSFGLFVIEGESMYAGVGISRYDISDPVMPPPVSITPAGNLQDLFVQPPYAYVSEWDSFRIYDVSDPAAPALLSSVPTYGGTFGLEVRDGLAYVGDDWALRIIDVSDPADPQVLSTFVCDRIQCDRVILDVTLRGDHVFICDSSALRAVDVSDPFAPRTVGSLALPGLRSLELVGSMLYGVDGTRGVRIIDVSDPTAPVLVATLPPGNNGACVSVDSSGDQVCVLSDAWWGPVLQVYDAADPANPVLRGELAPVPFHAVVDMESGFAYVVGEPVTEIVDLSNPDEPSAVAYILHGSEVCKAAASDDSQLYLAAGETGLVILDLHCALTTSLAGDLPSMTGFHGSLPNPFDVRTTIRYEIPHPGRVDVRILDASGRVVRELANGTHRAAGIHEVDWDGRNAAGRPVPAGAYFYRIHASDGVRGGTLVRVAR